MLDVYFKLIIEIRETSEVLTRSARKMQAMEYNTRNLEFLLPLLRLRESLAIKFYEQ